MNKLLLYLTLAVSLGATAQCPTSYKLTAGGGNCGSPANPTGKITFTFTNPFDINNLPTLSNVTAVKGVDHPTIIFSNATATSKNATTELTFCYSTTGQSDNIPVGGQTLYVTLTYQNGTTIDTKICAVGGTLPVKLSSFSAARQNQNVVLNWSTESEQDNDRFIIETLNGGTWVGAGVVQSKAHAGLNNGTLTYSFTHPNTSSYTAQYRLKQVDLSGKVEYSKILSVLGFNQSGIVVYPNPTKGSFSVLLPSGNSTVFVNDASGRTVKKFNNVVSSFTIDGLEKGLYTIQIKNGTGVKTKKLIVD
jgi:hypothetical protein